MQKLKSISYKRAILLYYLNITIWMDEMENIWDTSINCKVNACYNNYFSYKLESNHDSLLILEITIQLSIE